MAATEITPLLDAVEQTADWSKLVVTVDDERVVASPIRVKAGPAVKVVRGAATETVSLDAWPERARGLLEAAQRAHLHGGSADWHARRTRKGRWLVSRGKPSAPAADGAADHDRRKQYALPPEDPETARLFAATGLMTPDGRVRAAQADKYRQVQHYLELLRPLPIWTTKRLRVVDAGSGKAYMSLALVAYGRTRGVEVELTGVDTNEGVVESTRDAAAGLGYDARFEAATIADYARRHAGDEIDLLVSLHACDTATDEAIAAGLALGARAIVVAPCCHHELASQIGRGSAPPEWGAVLEHGLLHGRLADVITDALRAAALAAHGYRAEVIEFVAAEHTAKNLMIRAVRRPSGPGDDAAREAGRRRYEELKALWAVEPALEALVGPSAREDGSRGTSH